METIILITILIIIIAGFTAIFWLLKSYSSKKEGEKTAVSFLQNQINEVTRTLDYKLGESTQMMQKQSKEITQELTKVGEGQKQVINIAKQLENLQNILKNPKQRGVLGEYFLETVLKNVLPPGAYQMQYAFSNNVIVDAVVFFDKRIIPIDSKFSLENYNRLLEARDPAEKKKYEIAFVSDLKTRIEETSKYIKPEENTTDFAFMFIPSEAIYYDLLINKVGTITDDTRNLINYAGQKRVIVVSPTSFLAYLQTVLQGLRNQKISEQAKEIIKQVENLRRHLYGFNEYFMEKLGKNLGTTVSMYNAAHKEFEKIDKDFLKITGEAANIEPIVLEKPREE